MIDSQEILSHRVINCTDYQILSVSMMTERRTGLTSRCTETSSVLVATPISTPVMFDSNCVMPSGSTPMLEFMITNPVVSMEHPIQDPRVLGSVTHLYRVHLCLLVMFLMPLQLVAPSLVASVSATLVSISSRTSSSGVSGSS